MKQGKAEKLDIIHWESLWNLHLNSSKVWLGYHRRRSSLVETYPVFRSRVVHNAGFGNALGESLQTCVYPLREISHKPGEFQIRTKLVPPGNPTVRGYLANSAVRYNQDTVMRVNGMAAAIDSRLEDGDSIEIMMGDELKPAEAASEVFQAPGGSPQSIRGTE